MALPAIQKVYSYITYQNLLLLFVHVDFPDAGIQVPGGTVESREAVADAALREAYEETDLREFRLVTKLGMVERVLSEFGLDAVHERHYFHFIVDSFPGDSWISYEDKPSDGTEGSIAFRFFWAPITAIPPLAGGLDEMLPELLRSLNE
jgi:8-oxo-dGTP diphosphatase